MHAEEMARLNWTEIPKGSRHLTVDGARMVFGLSLHTGATILTPWVGPLPRTGRIISEQEAAARA